MRKKIGQSFIYMGCLIMTCAAVFTPEPVLQGIRTIIVLLMILILQGKIDDK